MLNVDSYDIVYQQQYILWPNIVLIRQRYTNGIFQTQFKYFP